MSVGRLCVRSVYSATPDESARVVARRMNEANVGALVVVDEKGYPVGIVTDRDLALRCIAGNCDPSTTLVSTIMTAPVVCVSESTPIEDALKQMARISARRLAVTDEKGRLAGLLALDDVLELLVEEAETIGRLLKRRNPPFEA
jgi:CBS domain-containing protein